MDLRGSYKWNDMVQFYGGVDNVWDTPPPNVVGDSSLLTSTILGFSSGMGHSFP